MRKKSLWLLPLFVLLFGHALFSINAPANGGTDRYPHGRYGIGFQRITWNCWGLSGMFEVTPRLAVEGLLGVVGSRQAFGFRGLFRFIKLRNANFYGYGIVGAEIVEEYGTADEMGLLVGAGAGFEYNLKKIIAGIISLGLNAEVGAEKLSGYNYINAGYTSMTFAAGFHLRI